MNITPQSIIGELVAQDYRTAAVFQRNGIDFCCQGNRTLADACQQQNLDAKQLTGDLQKVADKTTDAASTTDYKSWPIDLLADYVQKKHHRYVRAQIPVLEGLLEKIVSVHGSCHPELAEIKDLFDGSATELTAHMQKEELVLFPHIHRMVEEQQGGKKAEAAAFGSVERPIARMMQEHVTEGERFRLIRELTNNYTPPADACNTYRVAFGNLEDFENDLHLHIHLENNILFPKAVELEHQAA